MPRPTKCRRVGNPPRMKGFTPFGLPLCKAENVQLKFEEYESIRLVNYEMLDQEKAAEQMNVSRPTFTRIYNKALEHIAKAFVEGKGILIEGGNYELNGKWFRCKKCHKLIEGVENHVKCENCDLFGSDELVLLNH